MALLSVIRRWHFRAGMPIREIERRTGLSRNTIRKYLRAGTVEPKFKVPERPSKLYQVSRMLTRRGFPKQQTSESWEANGGVRHADSAEDGFQRR